MDLRLLRYFVTVAEERNFGRAAARLFIAQPSLSQQIRILEARLGAQLFDRNRHGVTLTAAGDALLAPAMAVLAAADELFEVVRAANRADRGQVTVGYVDYARARVLPLLLQVFHEGHGAVTAAVHAAGDSTAAFDDLRARRVDASVLRTPVSAPWMRHVPLLVEPFMAAVPRRHPLAGRAEVPLALLAEEPFALFGRSVNPGAYDHLMAFFDRAGRRPTVIQESRRMDESLMFVAGGRGVGLFPASVAASSTEPGTVFRPIVDPTPVAEIVLGWDAGNLNPLLPYLVTAARQVGELLAGDRPA